MRLDPVSFVVPKANPAELMLAFNTNHGVAAVVFLNWPFTFGTVLRVHLHPVKGLSVTFAFDLPLLHFVTICGFVAF